jgi:hypothetical protein
MHFSMSERPRKRARLLSPAALAAGLLLSPALALACACGCGIFDVGATSGIMPDLATGNFSVFFRYDYMNQNQNWEGAHKAAASDNADKGINTSFYTPGGIWQINHDWALEASLPIYARHLTTTDDGTVFGPAGSIYTGKIVALGDLEIMGVYTGLQANMQTGLIFGLKLPTGEFSSPKGPLGGTEFDRDSLPGTGSTDIILGIYHSGALTDDGRLGYFVQQRAQFALATQQDYRPGNEFDSAAGLDYTFDLQGWIKRVTPVLSILNSYRERDSGANADPGNSGYERVLIAPGVEFRVANLRVYADIEVPLYQHTNDASLAVESTSGQLVASPLYKLQVNYDF